MKVYTSCMSLQWVILVVQRVQLCIQSSNHRVRGLMSMCPWAKSFNPNCASDQDTKELGGLWLWPPSPRPSQCMWRTKCVKTSVGATERILLQLMIYRPPPPPLPNKAVQLGLSQGLLLSAPGKQRGFVRFLHLNAHRFSYGKGGKSHSAVTHSSGEPRSGGAQTPRSALLQNVGKQKTRQRAVGCFHGPGPGPGLGLGLQRARWLVSEVRERTRCSLNECANLCLTAQQTWVEAKR